MSFASDVHRTSCWTMVDIRGNTPNQNVLICTNVVLEIMASVYVEIEINASRERVWEVLIAKQRWKEWNSFFFDCDSSLPFQTGEVVCLGFRRHPGESETLIEPLCTRVQRNVCLAWIAEIPGFRSEQVFELQEIGFSRTKYTHRQDFSGFLCKVFFPFIRQDEQRAMLRMARELKRFMER